jgi:hypothetical protein
MTKSPAHKVKLTELFVKRQRPVAGKPVVLWDTLQRGLALRIQPTGRRSWYRAGIGLAMPELFRSPTRVRSPSR